MISKKVFFPPFRVLLKKGFEPSLIMVLCVTLSSKGCNFSAQLRFVFPPSIIMGVCKLLTQQCRFFQMPTI